MPRNLARVASLFALIAAQTATLNALLITSLIKWIEETRYAHTVAIEQHKAKEEMRISEIRLRRFLLDKKLDYLKGKEGYLEAINEYLEANDIDKQKEV